MVRFRILGLQQRYQRFCRRFLSAILVSLLIIPLGFSQISRAQSQLAAYCQLLPEAVSQTDALRQAAQSGDPEAQQSYKTLVSQQAEQLRQCRARTWPQNQALWLRLYPCDANPGALDELFDRIISRGYNVVYVEAFYDGQVLLPAGDNPTVWASIVRGEGREDIDLLQAAIDKGRERGIKVYAWLFTLNFGYSYSLRPEAEQTLARNGRGDNTLTALASGGAGTIHANEVFVDPYSAQAKRDYYTLVQAILRRQPDGVLFDYIRYPWGQGAESVASQVQNLWIYGPSSQQALFDRAMNQKGQELIHRYLSQGRITAADLSAVNSLYPNEGVPLWQGRDPNSAATVERLQSELWLLSVAHAVQGILDFLQVAVYPVQQRGLPTGAVFFPEANQRVGTGGYDSRLQPWDRFPSNMEWHPMSYALCPDSSCIVEQVRRVLSMAPSGTQVMPVLAGTWGRTNAGHPPLENQMRAIYQATPQINTISHFAYSWQDPEHDRVRKFCRL
jgi:hypothetical protein